MKAAELREMSDEQLAITAKETAESLFKLRVQAQTERLDVPTELRKQRKLIARIKTVQMQRTIAAAAKAAESAKAAAAAAQPAAQPVAAKPVAAKAVAAAK